MSLPLVCFIWVRPSKPDESMILFWEARLTRALEMEDTHSLPASRVALGHSEFMLLLKETNANQLLLPRKLYQNHFLHYSTREQYHAQR